jgi:hypothetical protein
MDKVQAEIQYYSGYFNGLQDALKENADEIWAEVTEIFKGVEQDSAIGYYTIGRIEGMKRALELTAYNDGPSCGSPCATPCSAAK